MKRSYSPAQGDLVWLTFSPQAGHEQAGRRPAVVLSPSEYNRKLELALFCPVTSRVKGYPFEVSLPPGLPISGVILADHLKNLDWKARNAEFIEKVDAATLGKALALARTLLSSAS